MRRAFVSHSTADDGFVAEMESFLRAAGFDEVFNDVHTIKPDEKFWPRIEQGITDCDAFILVITAASTSSEWVKREVELARHLGKRIIPVWREDCPLPPEFGDRDVIDFRPRTRKERRFDIGRIIKYAPSELIGREDETKLLNEAWQKTLRLEKGRPHILTFVALGGEGKTSLVAKWAAGLAGQDWPGCDAAFAWSFYRQGTQQGAEASSYLFLKEALEFFGDEALANSAASSFHKGRRLAYLAGKARTLIILDGVEPLQRAPTSPLAGELVDHGVAELLKSLASTSHGLCVVTTRYPLSDLKVFRESTAREERLRPLSTDAGVRLLHQLHVNGDKTEFAALVESVKGHALTLSLLGNYLWEFYLGDIRKRDRVDLRTADEAETAGHSFRVLLAYERDFYAEGPSGRCALAILNLIGLFNQPTTRDRLEALLQPPSIPCLTDLLITLPEERLNMVICRLHSSGLLTLLDSEDSTRATTRTSCYALDTHPLIREYFAGRCRETNRAAWKEAHKRLYAHLCDTSPTYPDTRKSAMRLYSALEHACEAGLEQHAIEDVYCRRISHGDYATERYGDGTAPRYGLYASELNALGKFYEARWTVPRSSLTSRAKALLLNDTAFDLQALGRIRDAIEVFESALQLSEENGHYRLASTAAVNLADSWLILGRFEKAHDYAERSEMLGTRVTPADALSAKAVLAQIQSYAGDVRSASRLFRAAETFQQLVTQSRPLLHSYAGYRYCEFMLDMLLESARAGPLCRREWDVKRRGLMLRIATCLAWAHLDDDVLCAAAYRTLLGRMLGTERLSVVRRDEKARELLDTAVCALRQAGILSELPKSLVCRAEFAAAVRDRESARMDLDEAWELARRDTISLFLADIHLARARFFFREESYPWSSPESDLAAAEMLINECGYHRRDKELADARRAILGGQP